MEIREEGMSPIGMPWVDLDIDYDAETDLALEMPDDIIELGDMGYSEETRRRSPSRIAHSGAFRLLSAAGVGKAVEVCKRLSTLLPADGRQRKLASSVYRSRFVRDLCACPKIAAHVGLILDIEVLPTELHFQRGFFNFTPAQAERNVVNWHYDTANFVLVVLLSDPVSIVGGEYEWFDGTVAEAEAEIAKSGKVPDNRIRRFDYGAIGFASVAQGNLVQHRVTAVRNGAERITMVNPYVPADLSFADPATLEHMRGSMPDDILYPSWVRYKALRAIRRLEKLTDPALAERDLARLKAEVDAALADLEAARAGVESGIRGDPPKMQVGAHRRAPS